MEHKDGISVIEPLNTHLRLFKWPNPILTQFYHLTVFELGKA